MSRPTDDLIDTLVKDSDISIPQRAFVLIVGLDHTGEPVLEERWINIEDLEHRIDEYTKCADISFVQQGLIRRQIEGD